MRITHEIPRIASRADIGLILGHVPPTCGAGTLADSVILQ
jgi:hypothetical protein